MIVQKLPGMGASQLKVVKETNPLGIELVTDVREDYKAIIDPADAKWIIDHMHPGQRRPSQSDITHYMQLIKSDRFIGYMQPGIMFDQKGRACNAQHRLRAQVACEATLEWMIRVGCTDEEVAATDQTRKRRTHQSFNLVAGDGQVTPRGEAAFRTYLALANSPDIMTARHHRLSVEELVDLKAKRGPEVSWALDALPKRTCPASMVGAMAFAYPVNPVLVQSFADEYVAGRLGTGTGDQNYRSPATVLARWMNTTRDTGGAGGTFTIVTVHKTLSALRAHIEGRTLAKLYSGKTSSTSELKEPAKPVRFFTNERHRLGLDT